MNQNAADLLRASGSSRHPAEEQVRAVLHWPGLYDLAEFIQQRLDAHIAREAIRRRGRRSPYPTAALLAVWIYVRIFTSVARTVTELRSGLWQDVVRPTFEEMTGLVLPLAAPNRDQVTYFRNRLEEVHEEEPLWGDLSAIFTRVSVAQAQAQGNLLPGVTPDWTQPDMAHTIIGDGTVVRPRCDAPSGDWDPVAERYRFEGNRVRSMQDKPAGSSTTDLTEDDKAHLYGLNMVAYLTPTAHGWVILGTDYALRAEQWPALDLLDSIAGIARGGVHNLLYDGVYTGWVRGYALGRHRVRVINKIHVEARREKKKKGELKAPSDAVIPGPEATPEQVQKWLITKARRESDPTAFVQRLAAEHDVALSPALASIWRQDRLHDIFSSGEAQPLGICLYPTTTASAVLDRGPDTTEPRLAHRPGRRYDVVHSRYRALGTHHHAKNGITCEHVLYVDDGALFTVDLHPHDGHLIKTGKATCTSSTPQKREDGTWKAVDRWTIPCGEDFWEFTTTWAPSATRYTPEQTKQETKQQDKEQAESIAYQKAVSELGPISRSDFQAFADTANFRNNSESFNNWYKNTLIHKGRANTDSVGAQLFDFHNAACLKNAITWMNADLD